MFTNNLINNTIPRLKPKDTVAKALQLLNDFRITHLPVVNEDKFIGMISEEDLLDLDEEDHDAFVDGLREHYLEHSVPEKVHFMNAVNYALQHDTNVVPVCTAEGNFVGLISTMELMKELGNFAGANEIGGLIVMQMERSQFSISEISRLAESNDCTILHLNTTTDPETGLLTVTIHLNKRELAALVATYERYDYDVIYFNGTERFENEISANYNNLMKYLDI